MNPVLNAVGLGAERGLIEFRKSMTSFQDLGFAVIGTAVFVVVLYFQRDLRVPGVTMPMSAVTLPGMVGLMLALNGFLGAVGALSVEREDGTLLRAKALPQGMVGYLVGRVVSLSLTALAGLLVLLVAGALLVPGASWPSPGGWLAVAAFAVLGLLVTLPIGAVVGSLAGSPASASGLALLGMGAITAVSGIFYPVSALAGWAQGLAQVFPMYWLGLGMRSALLPDAAAAAEIGGSWRTLETFAVLLAWAVAALLLAPPVLRRMARRESGSLMQARRERVLGRLG